MSKYPPSKRKQQDLQNQKDNAGFMTEVKLEQNNSSVIKSKKEESQDYLSNLWNRLNHENVQESLKMVKKSEGNVMKQLEMGELAINEKVENIALITENYKMEKMEQQQRKDQLKEAERKKNQLEMKLDQLDVDIDILKDLKGNKQDLKHIDIEWEKEQQLIQEQKMKKIRIERKQLEKKRYFYFLLYCLLYCIGCYIVLVVILYWLLYCIGYCIGFYVVYDENRQEIQREQEMKIMKEHESEIQQKRQEIEYDKENRVSKSKQNNEMIQNRLQTRDQEIEKFRGNGQKVLLEEIKELKKNRPENVVLKDDVMYKQLKEKKKQLKNVRDLMSNPIIHENKNDIYKANYESKYYRDYVNDYKVHKQVHLYKKQGQEEQEKKMKLLEEEIKRKHKPIKSAKLEKELQEKIEYWDKEVKRPKRKLKGKEYDYIEPKNFDKKEQLKIGQEYMQKAKLLADRNRGSIEMESSLSEQQQKQQRQDQLQMEYEKRREIREHDLKNLEEAKKRGRYQNQSQNQKDFREEVMKDQGCSMEKKQMILKEHSEKLLLKAIRLEEEERMKNQSSTILDQNYYLGKRVVKNKNQSSQQLQSKTEQELVQREQVNELYLDSIKAKMMIAQQKG